LSGNSHALDKYYLRLQGTLQTEGLYTLNCDKNEQMFGKNILLDRGKYNVATCTL